MDRNVPSVKLICRSDTDCLYWTYMRINIERFFDTKALVVECTPKRVNCPIGGKSYTLNEGRELGLIKEGLENKDDCWVAQYPWMRDSKRLPENKEFASRN